MFKKYIKLSLKLFVKKIKELLFLQKIIFLQNLIHINVSLIFNVRGYLLKWNNNFQKIYP